MTIRPIEAILPKNEKYNILFDHFFVFYLKRTKEQFDRLTLVANFITCLQRERNELVFQILLNGSMRKR